MDSAAIKALFARHIVSLRRESADLDSADITADFRDSSIGLTRHHIIGQLAPLMEADSEDILAALDHFGLGEMDRYFTFLAGSHELEDHVALAYAAIKLGQPELSWDDVVAEHDSMNSLDRKNLQRAISSPYIEKLALALQTCPFVPDEIPFIADSLYADVIATMSDFRLKTLQDKIERCETLADYIIEQFEEETSGPADEKRLFLAGLFVALIRFLPGNDKSYYDERDVCTGARANVIEAIISSAGKLASGGDEKGLVRLYAVKDRLVDVSKRSMLLTPEQKHDFIILLNRPYQEAQSICDERLKTRLAQAQQAPALPAAQRFVP